MYISVLLTCLYTYQMCAWCLQRSEEGVGSLGAEMSEMHGCEPPHGRCEPNLDPREEQQVLLATDSIPILAL